MLATYNKLNLLHVANVAFKPGLHEYQIDQKWIEQNKALYPKFKAAIEDKVLEFTDENFLDEDGESGMDGANAQTLSGMKEKDAIKLVRQAGDINLLLQWKQTSNSQNVRKAIDDQIKAIETAGEPKKES